MSRQGLHSQALLANTPFLLEVSVLAGSETQREHSPEPQVAVVEGEATLLTSTAAVQALVDLEQVDWFHRAERTAML